MLFRSWILDEPFTALDKAGVVQLEKQLSEHAEAGGLVLVTSHQDILFPQLQSLNLQDFVENSTEGDLAYG